MKTVLDMGKEIEEAEKEEFILNLLSSLLMVVGLGGGALVEVGINSLGKWLVRVAESGATAIGLAGVVEDPKSAPLLIFGLIMSGRSILETEKAAKAATLRRSMKYNEIASFNKGVADMMEKEKSWNKKVETTDVCKWRYA
jgi:hypothetical protein